MFKTAVTRNVNKNYLSRTINSILQLEDQQLRHQTTVASTTTVTPAADEKTPPNEWENARPFEDIPTSNLLSLVMNLSLPWGKYYKMDRGDALIAVQHEYGEIFRFPDMISTPGVVMTTNPNDFEAVFRTEGIWPMRLGNGTLEYQRSKLRADFYKGSEGLLHTQEEKWGKFRSAVNPVMMQPKNVKLYLNKMSKINQEFVERIRLIRNPQTLEMPENFETEINLFTLESISVVALDQELGLLKANHDDKRAQELLKTITDFFELSAELDLKPSLWRYFATPKFKRLMKTLDNGQRITLDYINDAIQRIEQEHKAGVERTENEKSVLEKLLKIDQKIATVMAMDMLLAGVDTTTSTLSGILLNLAKNPEKQAKLREEVLKILPNKDSDFPHDTLNNIPYLRACIKESLRLYPLTDGNARVTKKDLVLSGYRVPKDTFVMMLYTTLFRDAQQFSQPNEFIPERWLRTASAQETAEEDVTDVKTGKCPHATKAKNPFVYLPFGFGPRSCIGRRIAELELELVTARIIRNFQVEFNYPIEKPFKTLLIKKPNIPLKFKMTDVN